MKLDFSDLYTNLTSLGKGQLSLRLDNSVTEILSKTNHGDYSRWQSAIDAMPDIRPSFVKLDSSSIVIGTPANIRPLDRELLREKLMALHPWRKGPFELFGIKIDTEWRSDWKWDRLKPHISPLSGKTVLDVGCGSGYHCLRMLGDGAAAVVGIEPSLIFVMQFQALNKYIRTARASVLPVGIEHITGIGPNFDTVFSMGVLYHRRDPVEHIHSLWELLKPGGELVLETIVIEGQSRELLIPDGRYARMRNVWSLPSIPLVQDWMAQAGMADIRCVDVSRTTSQEQRATDWMTFESLDKCLDCNDLNKTVEGLPAPVRAIFVARKQS